MSDSSERFIAAAVRPLEDNAEMQVMAGEELRSMIAKAGDSAANDSLDEATLNLERRSPQRRWRAILCMLCALVSLMALIPAARDYQRYRIAIYTLLPMGDPIALPLPGLPMAANTREKLPGIFGNFTPSERLLLFGDLTKTSEGERFKALWNSEPNNPAFFAEYALAWTTWGDPLPADYLASADRLEPGNARFRHLAAAVAARNALDPSTPHRASEG